MMYDCVGMKLMTIFSELVMIRIFLEFFLFSFNVEETIFLGKYTTTHSISIKSCSNYIRFKRRKNSV